MAKYSRVKQSGDVTNFTSTAELPLSGLRRGETAFANNSLYISNGSGWYRITLVNESPSITLESETVSLGTSGNTVTVGYTVVEPEGTPVNVTATTTANTSQANVTINSSNNSLTIENLSAEGFSANVTLSATDGVNIGTDSLVLNVSYLSELWDETVLSIGTSSTNSLDNITFIDRSTNAHTVTPTGSPVQTAFHPYLDYYGIYLDGSSWYSVTDNFSDFQFDTGDYTAEIWVKPDDTSTGSIFGVWSDTNAGNQMWYIQQTSVGFRHWIDPADTIINQSDASDVVPGKWTHIAITRSGSTFRMFIDGTKVSESTSAGYNMQEGGGYLTVGRAENGSYFNGYVADAHVIKGYAKYTSDFDMPTEPVTAHANTKFLAFRKNRIYDESSSSHSIGVNGSPKVVAHNPFGQGSEYAAGENKGSTYLDGSDALDTETTLKNLGTSDFTIEMFLYPEDVDNICMIDTRNESNSGWMVFIETSGISFYAGGSRIVQSTMYINQWVHVAITRESGTVKLFINGVSVDTASYSSSLDGGDDFRIGSKSYSLSSTLPYEGFISDLKLTKGTALYTSGFTPPTAPVGNTNADLYLPMDNAGIFDKTGMNTLTLFGDTSTSTTQTKFADTAMYFDGSEDYITTDFPALGTGDFTIEFWINPSTINSEFKALFDTRTSNANNPLVWIRDSNVIYYYTNSADAIIGTTTLSTNTWYHVAACRSSGTTKLFLNGTQEGSDYGDTASYTADILVIGQRFNIAATPWYHGYIENFQILKGVAKYTSNFTPPTQTQGRNYQAES